MKKNNSNIEYVEKPKSSHILRIHTVPNTIIFEPYAFYDIPTILKDALQYLKDSGTERGLVVNLNNVIVPIRSDMTNREAIQVWKNERNGKTNIFGHKTQYTKISVPAKQKEPGE